MASKSQPVNKNNGASKKASALPETDSTYASGSARSSNGKQSRASNQTTLRQLFTSGLKDVYSAEQQLLEALPEMAKAADNEDLQAAFQDHLKQTQKHVERLEKVFSRLGIEASVDEPCAAMEGLIEEGRKIISEFEESAVRDAALIIGAQKIEHYEIASYGSLCEIAEVMGLYKVSDILDRTLSEEESTDLLLTDIARDVNDEACRMDEGQYDRN